MGSVSGQDPLDPSDPKYYAPPRLRERSPVRRPQGTRLEPVPPISPPSPFDSPLKNAAVTVRNPLPTEMVREPLRFARETDQRASRFGLAARLAVAAGVVAVAAVVALVYLLMAPGSRQPDTEPTASSAPSEITGSAKTDLPPTGQADLASKPALAQFKALLATAPASQPAPQEDSKQLLQRFMQWREKDNSNESSR